jgi:hypothetical protein
MHEEMRWEPWQSSRVAELWASGWTGEQIAKEMGLTRDQVLSKVRRMGLVRALRFADEVATYGCVEKAALAAGVSVRRGRLMFERMVKGLGWQAG